MSSVRVYVDGCVMPTQGAGIGVFIPSLQREVAEPLPRHLKFDVNICELYAIIRGMELAQNWCLTRVCIVTDSQQAYNVGLSSDWPPHFMELKQRFQMALNQLQSVNLQMAHGDHHHRKADELACIGAGKY